MSNEKNLAGYEYIYGRIVERGEEDEISSIMDNHRGVIVYGFDVIRKELRDVSKGVRHGRSLVRLALLGLYDKVVKSHIYQSTSPIKQLAGDYYKAYREIGGNRSERSMMNDFLIVACASIHELGIVVSEDNKTMLSEEAAKAYRVVNGLKKYKTPNFAGYNEFRRLFS